MLTPVPIGYRVSPDYLWIRFVRTDADAQHEDEPLEADTTTDRDQKYGAESPYRRFDRLEEPEILGDLCYAASRLRPEPGEVVLSLGCNDARELEMFDFEQRRDLEFIGVDVAPSAIEAARRRFPDENFSFVCEDLARVSSLGLPQIDIALVLGVLQCTSVDRDALLRDLMKQLGPKSRLLVSIPNCHFGRSDVLRRPLDRRSRRHDRSPVHKDLRFLTRTFYRHGFRRFESFGT